MLIWKKEAGQLDPSCIKYFTQLQELGKGCVKLFQGILTYVLAAGNVTSIKESQDVCYHIT
jgi:hypothetical protein